MTNLFLSGMDNITLLECIEILNRIKSIPIKIKAKIRTGACVMQDMHICSWSDTGEIFDFERVSPRRCRLSAPHYGDPDCYGNGGIFANIEDIIIILQEGKTDEL